MKNSIHNFGGLETSGKKSILSTVLLGFLVLIGALITSVAVTNEGIKGGIYVLAPLLGAFGIFLIITKPRFGILFVFIFVWFIMFIIRLGIIDFPYGTLVDAMELLLVVALLIDLRKTKNWKIFNNPISYMVLIWIIYNLIQFANPSAESRLAWLYTIRSVAGVMLLFFVFVYYINDIKFIRLLINIWIGMSALSALYGLKQEFIGFSNFEYLGLADPQMAALLFIDGHWRTFSTFSDPVAFSYNMVAAFLLCAALIPNGKSLTIKLVYASLCAIFFWSMIYSGTRGAFVLIPGAAILWIIMHLNAKVIIASIIAGFLFLIFISFPTSNPNIVRFQSSFRPSNDASYNVRKANQKKIQPYVITHPIGGGLGATGVWGTRFAPYSFLASFPPDSGYVRVAVELGWLGLLLFCTFMFVCLWVGIRYYFSIKDPELKSIALAMLLIVFALNLGNFPQEALVQFPSSVYFYFYIALIVVVKRLDDNKQLTPVNKL